MVSGLNINSCSLVAGKSWTSETWNKVQQNPETKLRSRKEKKKKKEKKVTNIIAIREKAFKVVS